MTLKIEAGKTYLCRDGKTKVRVIDTKLKDDQPVIGVLMDEDGDESVEYFQADGYYYEDCSDGYDLVSEVLPTRTVYLNLYSDGGIHAHSTADGAKSASSAHAVLSAHPVEVPDVRNQ